MVIFIQIDDYFYCNIDDQQRLSNSRNRCGLPDCAHRTPLA